MPAHKSNLKKMQEEYIANLKKNGVKVIEFEAPCCGKKTETRAAPVGQPFDTMAVCVHCGAVYFRIVSNDKVAASVDAPGAKGWASDGH